MEPVIYENHLSPRQAHRAPFDKIQSHAYWVWVEAEDGPWNVLAALGQPQWRLREPDEE